MSTIQDEPDPEWPKVPHIFLDRDGNPTGVGDLVQLLREAEQLAYKIYESADDPDEIDQILGEAYDNTGDGTVWLFFVVIKSLAELMKPMKSALDTLRPLLEQQQQQQQPPARSHGPVRHGRRHR